MEKKQKLEYGKYYHIYNCGNNREDLFITKENYEYFLQLYDSYISPIADTFAWCLMKNHFHFLIRIKDETEILDHEGFKNLHGLKPPYQFFSNLFNAYTKAINKKYGRKGALFTSNFKRKQITNEKYLKTLIVYIHSNPIHHEFCENIHDYPWNSYLTCISDKPTKLKRDSVIEWFDNIGNFKEIHKRKIDFIEIEKNLEI